MKTGRKRNAQKKRWVKLPTLVSMISITMVLLLLGSVVLFALTANELSKSVRESLTVTVVLQDDIAVTEAKAFNDSISALPFVKHSQYISSEQALEEQSKSMGLDPSEFLGSNPFSISLELAMKHQTPILPVDSEHSAIFQCLAGEMHNKVEKLILTASGGPFRTFTKEQLEHVTRQQALKHPNWSMGAKITIDSASMMNKGFEVIEAKWLFDVTPEQIEVVVHPQSVIHSMVQFADGSVKAQLGTPDMRLPIQYAFSYPQRLSLSSQRLDFSTLSSLTFEQPDPVRFRNLALSFEALERGGNMACILNAANEVCVAAFLKERIGFLQIADDNIFIRIVNHKNLPI